jgi:RimJ/RimL family protein N-acetyltransferase
MTGSPQKIECSLVPWADEHDSNTVRWLNDPRIRADFGITTAVTLDSHRHWRRTHAGLAAWAIVASGSHCGNILLDINRRHDNAYLQIYIGEPLAQGKGLGRSAMTQGLDQAFGTLALHRIWLHTRADNARARQLYSALGFHSEGIEREGVKVGGHYVDQERWALLANQWRRP